MSSAPRVLIVDDEEYVRRSLVELCDVEGFDVVEASGGREALELLQGTRVDVVLTDLKMPEGDGRMLLSGTQGSGVPVVVITGAGTVSDAVDAMKAGAFDFVLKPMDADLLAGVLRRAIEHAGLRSEVQRLREELDGMRSVAGLVGSSRAMAEVRTLLARVAPTDSTVLVLGESGTGKELAALEVHRLSRRSERNLICVNCAAIPENLFESEVFGHRKGAFSGAFSDRAGRFQEADGGTLVLDEVGTLGLEAQAKLLRVIESGEFQVVGESRTRTADIRLVAMTNEDLAERVSEGAFREDLYYRLNVFPVRMPALREHREDLPELALHLLATLGVRNVERPLLKEDALQALLAYDWPGNVRELRNVLERASILAGDAAIDGALLERLLGSTASPSRRPASDDLRLRPVLDRTEKDLLEAALERAGDRKAEAAELLGIDPKNLGYYLKKHGIRPEGRRAA